VQGVYAIHVTGQGSLRYRNATESRTQVAPVLKAKDYALIESLDEEITHLCKSAEIVDRRARSSLYIRVMVSAGSIPATLTN